MDFSQAIADISGIITIVSAIIAIVQSVRAWNQTHPGLVRSGMNRLRSILLGGLLIFIGIAMIGNDLALVIEVIGDTIRGRISFAFFLFLLILVIGGGWVGFAALKKGRVYLKG